MSTRDSSLLDSALDEAAFLARYRFCRPVALGVARVFTEHRAPEIRRAVRRSALRTLRFLDAVLQAQRLAAGSDSTTAPQAESLSEGLPTDYFITELAHQRRGVERLLGLTQRDNATAPDELRTQLLEALAELTPLAHYRLLVPTPPESAPRGGTEVLLGAQISFSGPNLGELPLPEDAPVLLDPPTGRLLSLSPLLRWEHASATHAGSVFLLRELKDDEGVFAEIDQTEARRLRRPLTAPPTLCAWPKAEGLQHTAALPAVQFADGQRVASRYGVRGVIERDEGVERYLAVRLSDNAPVVLETTADDTPDDRIVAWDYLSGGTLADRLGREGVLSPREALALLEPLCAQLGTLQDAGIDQVDLRPESLLLTAGGQLHLPSRCTLRSPPDAQLQLGVLLSELLVGERPQAPSGVARPPLLPRQLGGVIRRLLEPRPQDRFDSVPAALTAVREAVAELRPLRCVALDLEGTLLTTAYNPLPRPHLAEFAAWCLETFDRTFIYTAVDDRTARVIIARFVRAGVLPARFSKEVELVSWPRGSGGVLKDLRHLRLPIQWVVLLDDMRDWIVQDQRHRWVPIDRFEGNEPGDEALRTIRPELLARFPSR